MEENYAPLTLVSGYKPTSVFSYPQQAGINEGMLTDFVSYLDTAPSTAVSYAKSLKVFFEYLQAKGISNPTREDLIAYRATLLSTDKATTTATYINALKQFFKWLDYKGIYKDITNHLKGAKVGHEHRKEALTLEQARDLLASFDTSNLEGARDYAITYLCITCGLRTIEVVRANVEDMRFNAGFMALAIQGKGRQDKDQLVKLPYQVEKAIRAYLSMRGEQDGKAPLFTSLSDRNNGARLTTQTISKMIKASMRKCDINNEVWTAHSLRHTCATLALLNGATLEETQQMLRHQNLNTTMIYNHALERAKNNSEQKVADAINQGKRGQ
jgi:integrase/recombinase XerD